MPDPKSKYGKRSMTQLSNYAEYGIWSNMIQRCTNPKAISYSNYGGRGITVSPEWTASFETFYNDMGDRPFLAQLDRIDNDGPYCKANCTWTTRLENSRKSRQTKLTKEQVLEIRNSDKPRLELAALYNISLTNIGNIITRRRWKDI